MNQIFCNLFIRKSNAVTVHPLDEQREWFLLYDTVHLLKCIRNNWISEKTTTITFDDITIGYFKDVQDLYKFEKDSILKTTPLQTLQMNGSNAFMTVKDVSASFKKRLRTFSAKILETLFCHDSLQPSRVCKKIRFDEADGIKKSPIKLL